MTFDIPERKVLRGLASKLKGLDLGGDEMGVLDKILARAAAYEEPEVQGFAMDEPADAAGSLAGTDEELADQLHRSLGIAFQAGGP